MLTPEEKDAIAKPKVAALWWGGIMSATDARQMEMQEKAPREACRDTAQLMRHQALRLRQLNRASCCRCMQGLAAPARLMTLLTGSQTVIEELQGRTSNLQDWAELRLCPGHS